MRLLALLVVVAGSCRTEPLAIATDDRGACGRVGGRCVVRAADGTGHCASDELTVQLPDLCTQESDCCVGRCPELRPGPGDPCSRAGLSCQYQEHSACVQAICASDRWYLAVSDCDDARD
jgi:hypothetical protein